jgi:hypothetical protein
MDAPLKSILKYLFRGAAWLSFLIAGIAFWIGGRAISEFVQIGRIPAEMWGIGFAFLFAWLGTIAKGAEHHLEPVEGGSTQMSEAKSLRK